MFSFSPASYTTLSSLILLKLKTSKCSEPFPVTSNDEDDDDDAGSRSASVSGSGQGLGEGDGEGEGEGSEEEEEEEEFEAFDLDIENSHENDQEIVGHSGSTSKSAVTDGRRKQGNREFNRQDTVRGRGGKGKGSAASQDYQKHKY
jgi:hypothetical protein